MFNNLAISLPLYFFSGLRHISFITAILTLLENISSNVLWNFIYLLYGLSFMCMLLCLYVRYFVQYYKYLLKKLQTEILNRINFPFSCLLSNVEDVNNMPNFLSASFLQMFPHKWGQVLLFPVSTISYKRIKISLQG